MAREYGSRRSSRRGNGLPQQVLVMIVTFALGYFTASIFDIEKLGHWMTTQVLDNPEPKARSVVANQKDQVLPKPKFEFYTLLANEKGVGAAAANKSSIVSANSVTTSSTAKGATGTSAALVASHVVATKSEQIVPNKPKIAVVTTAKPAAAVPASRAGVFVVQVAAFKARQDAERMKGQLTLKGFEVSVAPTTTQAQGTWYRVVIGPYPNKTLAQKAQVILAKTQRLHGMIRTNK